ncbi:flagellar hook-associated protein FlgL [SAR92 clade bacterium H455]|uniref:Flagellar hook-associated protein FlgL n=1 Tax=SAR92 clade bacterium H455 TaxID=2974818 RepID=A0ABY5TMM8_9GAMM|nr:flagellar hook-associated protein FlgL [SAR92 clade bacterium H455]
MKVSTSQIFERAMTQMSNQQAKVADLQSKLATGQQITRPSDDPEKAGVIQRLTSANQRLEGYQNNLTALNSRLGTEEGALKSSENILQRMRELAVQASSDSFSPADREIIATEASALRDQLVSLANSADASGNYVFAGAMTSTVPFAENAEGETVYQGDNSRMLVDVSDQRQLALNKPGNEVFSSVVRETSNGTFERVGFFAIIDDFTAALENNDTDQIGASLGEISDLTQGMAMAMADVGSRMTTAQSQVDALTETKVRYQALLSAAQDLDYTSAITQLTSEIMSLEAGQSSFMKISQLSLFDYIR